jgi:two-component system nitrate/nitrite response regulator NarL
MKEKIKLMLVEDSPEYRHVINFAFRDDPDVEITSQFGTAEQAMLSVRNSSTGIIPDVALLDLNLPGMSGIEALPSLAKLVPTLRIIILTQSESAADVLSAIRQGAAGYLLKSATIQEVKAGVQTVMEGGASVDAKMARYILDSLKGNDTKDDGYLPLSIRETEILALIGEGLARKEIGDKLEISPKTVANHIAHIFEKLNVPNAPSAISKAYRIGLFDAKD